MPIYRMCVCLVLKGVRYGCTFFLFGAINRSWLSWKCSEIYIKDTCDVSQYIIMNGILMRTMWKTLQRKAIYHCQWSAPLLRVDFSPMAVLWSVTFRVIHSLTHPQPLCQIQIVLPTLLFWFLMALNTKWDMQLLSAIDMVAITC